MVDDIINFKVTSFITPPWSKNYVIGTKNRCCKIAQRKNEPIPNLSDFVSKVTNYAIPPVLS